MGTWVDEVQRSRGGLGYRRWGEGRPVVLLHGIPGSATTWSGVVERLGGDLDVVVPDLLGFGASARPRGLGALHAPAQAAAVADLVDELGLPPAVVVGHDFGGPVALTLLAQRPELVVGLGLLAANAFTDTPIPFPLSIVTWPVVGPLAGRVLFSSPSLRLMLRQGVGEAGPALDPAIHLGDRAQQQAVATIFAGSLARLAELYAPAEEQLRHVDVPVLVAWGDRDPFLPVEQGARTAAAVGTRLRVHEGAGHFLPQERPADVAADVAALVAATVR